MRAGIAALALVSVASLGLPWPPLSDAEDSELVIRPHAEMQQLMTDLLRPPLNASEPDLRRKLGSLIALARANGPCFVQQVVLNETSGKGNSGEVGPYYFLREANIPPTQYAEGLSELLYCRDSRIRNYARELFPLVLGRQCVRGYVDLSHVRDFVTGNYQRKEVAVPLKRAIFETAPSAAFLLYHTESKGIEMLKYRRAERVISNALFERDTIKQERDYIEFAQRRGLPERDMPIPDPWKVDAASAATIRELATSKHWWARMFAAEVMVQHKEFRDDRLIEIMLKDQDELVRNSIRSIREPDGLRFTKVDK